MLSEQENEDEGITVSGRLFGFLILGIALVFVGIVVLVVASLVLAVQEVLGLLFLSVHFQSFLVQDQMHRWLILIGIILAVLSIVFFLVMNRRFDWV